MAKQTADAGGVAVSNTSAPVTSERTETLVTAEPAAGAVVNLNLSRELVDKLSLEMRKSLHAVEMGWDTLAKPTEIAKTGATFYVVDGLVIEDYMDRRSGEYVTKCVFVLEYEDGHVETVMQSGARPRLMLCKAVENARLLGASFKAGPYKFATQPVRGQSQDAVIFERQPGWRQIVR